MTDIKESFLQWFIQFLIKGLRKEGLIQLVQLLKLRLTQTKIQLINYTNQLIKNSKTLSKFLLY